MAEIDPQKTASAEVEDNAAVPQGIPGDLVQALQPLCRRRSIFHRRDGSRRNYRVLKPKAAKILLEAGDVGIEELWNVIKNGEQLYLDLKKAYDDDGKLTGGEIGLAVLKRIGGIARVFTHLKDIGLEWVDLRDVERKELISRYEELHSVDNVIAERKVELIFDFALTLADASTDFVVEWKEIEDSMPVLAGDDNPPDQGPRR